MTNDIAMDTKWYQVGPSKVRVRRCSTLVGAEYAAVREVMALQTPQKARGEGYATTLMHKVCRDADRAGVVLVLEPKAFGDGGLSTSYLMSWYEQTFGFLVVQASPVTLMARMPHTTPRPMQLNRVTEAVKWSLR